MIGRLTGRLAAKAPDQVLLDVGGVGYQVHIPLSTFYELPDAEAPASLWIHTHVREDALSLYGFLTERERTLFLLLCFYAATWVLGGAALWLILRSVGAHPEAASVVFLGGTAAVGAIVAVVFVFAPSGLGVRGASMYGLLLAVATPGQALGAVALNRLALTGVELLLLVIGGLILRRRGDLSAGEPAEVPSL